MICWTSRATQGKIKLRTTRVELAKVVAMRSKQPVR